jgi:hypothetical protein
MDDLMTTGISKFQLWIDGHYDELCNVKGSYEDIAKVAWNACAKEALRMAREIKVSQIDNKEDYLIGLLAQLKDPKI